MRLTAGRSQMKRREFITFSPPTLLVRADAPNRMNRRNFITVLGGAAAAWPLAARAQQRAMPVVSFVSSRSLDGSARHAAAFTKGLSEIGYVDGQNVVVEYHWLSGQNDRLPALMADLARRRVAVIATAGDPPTLAAKAATTTFPIAFGFSGDPVGHRLVASLARPGGNATGFNFFASEVVAKRLGLLRELAPKAVRVVVLVNPTNAPSTESTLRDVQEAARAIGRVQLATLATHYRLPAAYPTREVVEIGGLMSYGTDLLDMYRQVGLYTGRILKGANPANLPVEQPTKFDFVINLTTAKALGLEIPPTLLARADEVIE